ncbi:hypothetical protein C8A03DRAFT_38292 [Achaetomium macrosporum]|uniref:Uncharacterized protein n=1 Tax=Achaetomium macrosporum TaxID=79813 RepID=A0AAN7C3T6_9PEZI|nr:hypothetical protein C8A03DRAFT_38292 [Achaetomium macrosporum]
MATPAQEEKSTSAQVILLLETVSGAIAEQADKTVFAVGGRINIGDLTTSESSPITIRWDSGEVNHCYKASLPIVDDTGELKEEEIRRQLNGIRPSEYLAPPTIEYQLPERARNAKLFGEVADVSNSNELHQLRMSLVRELALLYGAYLLDGFPKAETFSQASIFSQVSGLPQARAYLKANTASQAGTYKAQIG